MMRDTLERMERKHGISLLSAILQTTCDEKEKKEILEKFERIGINKIKSGKWLVFANRENVEGLGENKSSDGKRNFGAKL